MIGLSVNIVSMLHVVLMMKEFIINMLKIWKMYFAWFGTNRINAFVLTIEIV